MNDAEVAALEYCPNAPPDDQGHCQHWYDSEVCCRCDSDKGPKGDDVAGMRVYAIIINDHHTNIDVEVYAEEACAIDRANEIAFALVHANCNVEPSEFRDPDCVINLRYCVEGDSVRVMKRDLK